MAKDQQGPIKKSDVITDEAIKAPLELADNFETADKTVNKLVDDVKKVGNAVPKSNSITEFQKAIAKMAEQEKEIVSLQQQVLKLGKAFKDPGPKTYTNALQQLKAEFKAAQAEMVKIQKTLGEDSKEFAEAANKAGELKDQLNAVAEAAKDASGGSGLEKFSSQFGRFKGQLAVADFKGATTTLQGLASTTKSLTFKEASEGVGQFGKSIGAVGKALLVNPIFLIAAAIALIVVAVVKLKDSIKFLDDAFNAVGRVITFVLDLGKDFLDWLGLTSFALQKRTDKIIENAAKEREAIQRRYDAEIAIATAAGKEVQKLEIEKQEAIIETLSLAIFAIDKELQQRKTLTSARKKELKEQREDLFKQLEDASVALQVARLKEVGDEKKKNKDLRDAAYQLQKFRIEQAILANDIIAKNTEESEARRVTAARANQELRNQLADLNKKHELDAEKLKVDDIALINEKAIADKLKATQTEATDENKIWEDVEAKRKQQYADDFAEFKKAFFQRIKIMKEAIADEQTLWNRGLDLQLRAVKENVINGVLTRRQGEEEISRIIKEQSTQRVQVEIDAVRKTLETVEMSIDEREQLAEKLYDLETKLLDAQFDQTEDKLPKQLAAIKQGYDALYSSLTSLATTFTQNQLGELQAQQDKLDKQTKDSLAAAGDNKKLQEQIQRDADVKQDQLDQKRRTAQRKQAEFEKQLALIQATIALSQAIVEAYTAGPGIGQALAIATAAAGAIQIAAIASKKIPAYAKGGENVPGGIARVSEHGSELLVTKDGSMYLTPDKETFMDVPAGSDIYSTKDTIKMLAKAGMANALNTRGTRDDAIKLFGRKVDELKAVIRNQRHGIMDMKHAEKLLKSGETSIKYLTSTYK